MKRGALGLPESPCRQRPRQLQSEAQRPPETRRPRRIDEAVGRYLAERGLASAAAAGRPAVRPSVVSNPATAVVDRFLARQPGGPAGSSTTEGATSGSAHPAKSPATTQIPSPRRRRPR